MESPRSPGSDPQPDARGLKLECCEPPHDIVVPTTPCAQRVGIGLGDRRNFLSCKCAQCKKINAGSAADERLGVAGTTNETTTGGKPDRHNHEYWQDCDSHAERYGQETNQILLTLPCGLKRAARVARTVERSPNAVGQEYDGLQVVPDLGHPCSKCRSCVLHLLAEGGKPGDEDEDGNSKQSPPDNEGHKDDIREDLPGSSWPEVRRQFHRPTIPRAGFLVDPFVSP